MIATDNTDYKLSDERLYRRFYRIAVFAFISFCLMLAVGIFDTTRHPGDSFDLFSFIVPTMVMVVLGGTILGYRLRLKNSKPRRTAHKALVILLGFFAVIELLCGVLCLLGFIANLFGGVYL